MQINKLSLKWLPRVRRTMQLSKAFTIISLKTVHLKIKLTRDPLLILLHHQPEEYSKSFITATINLCSVRKQKKNLQPKAKTWTITRMCLHCTRRVHSPCSRKRGFLIYLTTPWITNYHRHPPSSGKIKTDISVEMVLWQATLWYQTTCTELNQMKTYNHNNATVLRAFNKNLVLLKTIKVFSTSLQSRNPNMSSFRVMNLE